MRATSNLIIKNLHSYYAINNKNNADVATTAEQQQQQQKHQQEQERLEEQQQLDKKVCRSPFCTAFCAAVAATKTT